MATRFFDGALNFGELCVYPMRLHGPGAHVVLHEHAFPHLAHFWPGDKLERIAAAVERLAAGTGTLADVQAEIARQSPKYRVFAIRTDGSEVEIDLGGYGVAWIGAGVKHRIELIEGDEGRMACVFARYGSDGVYRVDPTASPVAYTEEQSQ